MDCKKVAIVPAYEPGEILLEVLSRLKEAGMEIVLIDDGSGPQYADLFLRASSYGKVLTDTVNKGKGAALKKGMAYVQNKFGEDCVVVTVDADGQHLAEDADRLCRIAGQQPEALILGRRTLKENVPLRSQFGNSVTRFVYRISTGLKVHDTQTGLRAFSAGLLPRLLAIPGERYEYEMNVLLQFARENIPIREVEIRTIYINNNEASHFDTLRDSCRIYKEILKFSASSFAGFLVDYAMYSLLLIITANLRYANVGARVVSAALNYTLNRQLVFQSKKNVVRSAVQYVLLAAAILCGNTMVLEWLVYSRGLHQMLAKLITECFFFFVSFNVQRFVIFGKEKKERDR